MSSSGSTYPRASSSPDRESDRPVRLAWEYGECTARTVSAFSRLTRAVERAGHKHVVLDMEACGYLSVSGLRGLMEWHGELARQGIRAQVSGLSPMLAKVFALAKLGWMVLETE